MCWFHVMKVSRTEFLLGDEGFLPPHHETRSWKQKNKNLKPLECKTISDEELSTSGSIKGWMMPSLQSNECFACSLADNLTPTIHSPHPKATLVMMMMLMMMTTMMMMMMMRMTMVMTTVMTAMKTGA